MSRKKKVKIFLVVIVVLYLVGTSYGLGRDDGAMGAAMQTVREKVADARREIQEEMDKPFILRLFGSLFGMEGNSFETLKEELPALLEDAMPDLLGRHSTVEESSTVACTGMRLADAVAYLAQKGVRLDSVVWGWDGQVEERYVKLGGTVLEAERTPVGGARLVIQYGHGYSGEEGLGDSGPIRRQNLAVIESELLAAREEPIAFCEFWNGEDLERVERALELGFSIADWRAAFVEEVSDGPFAPSEGSVAPGATEEPSG